MDVLELSLAIQVSLGAGYASYLLAYAGLRRAHTQQDALFLTLAFGVPSMLVFQYPWPHYAVVVVAIAAFSASLTIAAVWRRFLRKRCIDWIERLGIHRDDGLQHAWDGIIQSTNAVGQMSVHTKDGRILYLNDRTQFETAPWKGVYLGADGAVVMVVEEEEFPDGTFEEREDIAAPVWGTRLTYLPANEITRVNIRLAP